MVNPEFIANDLIIKILPHGISNTRLLAELFFYFFSQSWIPKNHSYCQKKHGFQQTLCLPCFFVILPKKSLFMLLSDRKEDMISVVQC